MIYDSSYTLLSFMDIILPKENYPLELKEEFMDKCFTTLMRDLEADSNGVNPDRMQEETFEISECRNPILYTHLLKKYFLYAKGLSLSDGKHASLQKILNYFLTHLKKRDEQCFRTVHYLLMKCQEEFIQYSKIY